ncbi:hypothetical protein LIER_19420 [Lithospermum erythrorhizon]|uniref:Uncharacterized protein n=1 Tax=Lithospermum erythrorhizon TaxID=34254 RepID=A0AAV3QHM0_LITER
MKLEKKGHWGLLSVNIRWSSNMKKMHPWDLCLALALHTFPNSDIIPMDDNERSLSDLFGDIDIPDNIDFMFDNASYAYGFDLNKDSMLSSMTSCCWISSHEGEDSGASTIPNT